MSAGTAVLEHVATLAAREYASDMHLISDSVVGASFVVFSARQVVPISLRPAAAFMGLEQRIWRACSLFFYIHYILFGRSMTAGFVPLEWRDLLPSATHAQHRRTHA